MKKILPVVPIIDTEGPTTGRADMVDSWESLGELVNTLTGDLRNSLRDSFDNPLIINWFLLDWTGYSKNDTEFKKRGHDIRLHAVWDFYRKSILSDDTIKITKDGLYWHYHHPPLDGAWGWNKNWNDSKWYEYILGKLILNHDFFPTLYRAGKYVETNDNSHWLEKWIPFDYSSISPVKRDFCDWSEATTSWVPYNPSFENYQHPGSMKRFVARSLPVAAKGGSGSLDIKEVESAFNEIKQDRPAIFSFHTHDYYRSILDEFSDTHRILNEISAKVGIPWAYSNALEALRPHTKLSLDKLDLIVEKLDNNEFKIIANHEMFCEQPFVIAEDKVGNVERIDTTKINNLTYQVEIPKGSSRIGIGANDIYGNYITKNISL